MSLVKDEYVALLALLNRVETRGLNEAKTLVVLEQKLQSRIAGWFDGHVTGFKQDAIRTESDVKTDIAKTVDLVEKV